MPCSLLLRIARLLACAASAAIKANLESSTSDIDQYFYDVKLILQALCHTQKAGLRVGWLRILSRLRAFVRLCAPLRASLDRGSSLVFLHPRHHPIFSGLLRKKLVYWFLIPLVSNHDKRVFCSVLASPPNSAYKKEILTSIRFLGFSPTVLQHKQNFGTSSFQLNGDKNESHHKLCHHASA